MSMGENGGEEMKLARDESGKVGLSQSELRVWHSLQQLDVPRWFLCYPHKADETLQNARSVSDILVDVARLSLPAHARADLACSVPNLLRKNHAQQLQKRSIPDSHTPHNLDKRNSQSLKSSFDDKQTSDYTPEHLSNHLDNNHLSSSLVHNHHRDNETSDFSDRRASLPRASNKYRKAIANATRRHSPPSSSSSSTSSFQLPSERLRSRSSSSLVPMRMRAFEEVMKGVKMGGAKERKAEEERRVVQHVASKPHVVTIRRIRQPTTPLLTRPLPPHYALRDDMFVEIEETHFPANEEEGRTEKKRDEERKDAKMGNNEEKESERKKDAVRYYHSDSDSDTSESSAIAKQQTKADVHAKEGCDLLDHKTDGTESNPSKNLNKSATPASTKNTLTSNDYNNLSNNEISSNKIISDYKKEKSTDCDSA